MKLLYSLLFLSIGSFTSRAASFEIKGPATASCATTPAEYTVRYNPSDLPNGGENLQWYWKLSGGKFRDGKTERIQSVNEAVSVWWNVYANKPGSITVELRDAGRAIQSGTKSVWLGLPRPLSIQLEEGPLSCKGNWFRVKTQAHLSDLEIVEWTIVNGMDAGNAHLGYVTQRGADGNRLFIKKKDEHLPLEISVRLRSDCGKSTHTTPYKTESFKSVSPAIVTPSVVRAGSENTFMVCTIGGGHRPSWGSSGVVIHENDNSASIYFSAPGEEFVTLSWTDCDGTFKEIVQPVKVVAGNQEAYNTKTLISSADRESVFKVFPNPSHQGVLHIELKDAEEGEAELRNFQGELLLRESLRSKLSTIDGSHFASGAYLISVRTALGHSYGRVSLFLD